MTRLQFLATLAVRANANGPANLLYARAVKDLRMADERQLSLREYMELILWAVDYLSPVREGVPS